MWLNPFLLSLTIIFLYMSFWYIIALIIERNDIADTAWGLGFVVVGATLYLICPESLHLSIVFLLTLFWGVRLSLHIYLRNLGKKEDFRYKKWREDWGRWFYLRTY